MRQLLLIFKAAPKRERDEIPTRIVAINKFFAQQEKKGQNLMLIWENLQKIKKVLPEVC